MAVVYVLSKSGAPLMPTTRCGHVRALLKEGKARVVNRKPFTIQLTYETTDETQSIILGIDPGRTNIGISAVLPTGESVFQAQLSTRNKEVPKLMKERKQHRGAHRRLKRRCKRQRRAAAAGTTSPQEVIQRMLPGCDKPIQCKGIRNKEARFNNRARPAGWLTPTARHLLDTHINLVRKVKKFLPISHVVLEVNRFAFMQLDNPRIQKWQYQRGPLFGKGSVKEAVHEMQEGHCIFCNKAIDHYHHIVPRRENGSETLENRAGLCEEHHRLVHTEAKWQKKLVAKKAGMNKKFHALSVLNQVIPALTGEFGKLFPQHTFVTTGKDTAAFRSDHDIPKDHHLDAYCIACSIISDDIQVNPPVSAPYFMRQFRRHDRQACHKQNVVRRYYDMAGVLVATNRRKAIEQKQDSLQEYRSVHSAKEVSQLTVKEHWPQYKDLARPMPGSMFLFAGSIFTLASSSGRHNGKADYYVDVSDERYLANKCIFIRQNEGLVFVG